MSPYKIRLSRVQINLVPAPSKLPRKTIKEALEESEEETCGETKTSRITEKTVPAVERFSVLDRRSFSIRREKNGLFIEAWDTPANRRAAEIFEEIRKLEGKEIRPDSEEDLHYAGMEINLDTSGELGRTLTRTISLEFEETPREKLGKLIRTIESEEEWKVLRQALSYDPFKDRLVWSPDFTVLHERKAQEAKLGVKYHCANCSMLFDGANLTFNLCPKCSQILEEVVEAKLWKINASLIGKRVRCKAIINGEGPSKAVYVKWSFECERCGSKIEVDFTSNDLKRFFFESLVANGAFGSREALPIIQSLPRTGACQRGQNHYWRIAPIEPPVDFREISLQDDLAFEESMDKSITSRNYQIIMFGGVPETQRVDASGTIILNPKNNALTLMVDSYSESSPIRLEPLSEEDKALLTKYFKNKSLPELLDFSEENIAPSIAGRSEAKLASLLTTASPIWISLDGKTPISGVLKTFFAGDKRTAKGSISRWWPERVGVGMHGIGESASRAGLSFYVDPESNMVIWGLLPQADMGLAVVEAIHGLPSEQMLQFREILVQQKVTVRMKATGARWARTRIIADANPPQSLSRYPYPCIAVKDLRCFSDPVDITRWDLFIPFGEKDVPEDKIVTVSRGENEEAIAAIRKLVSLAWSRRMEHFKISQEAIKRLEVESIRLIKQYRLDEIPFIHNGTKWQLLRLTASFALATLSTEDYENFVIENSHIDMAVEFLESLLDMWMLQEYKAETEGIELDEMKYQELKRYLSENESARKVYLRAVVSPADGQSLSGLLDMPYGSVRNILSELKTKNLIEKHGRSYRGTVMGVQLYRRISEEKARKEEEKTKTR